MRCIQDTSQSPSMILSAANMRMQNSTPTPPDAEQSQSEENQLKKRILPGFSLFHTFLCSPDTTHLEIIRSLGVRGTISFPISFGNSLWGLLSFHAAATSTMVSSTLSSRKTVHAIMAHRSFSPARCLCAAVPAILMGRVSIRACVHQRLLAMGL